MAFKVLLHNENGTVEEYCTSSLQYAKRYADLYRETAPYIEIIHISKDGEFILETFGKR